MAAVALQCIPHHTHSGLAYQHLHFRITTPNGIMTPTDLADLKLPPGLDYSQGIVLEGKGPIWLYGYLVHECHPAAWVGCYDPRLGAIVISTHTPNLNVGEVFKLELPAGILA
ncbi:CRISPR-associated ring nuclease Crn3/Csx3 [Spirulina sp. CCNP1310]|uniref:CRISPR-associated ring nuclease Crn3/Csx3 n=1 Tax=Spirulina sp. CCNP1310 TaxID=3110249 RepID=UPI002B208C11|nr:CRISPR-associated ring nuclease Crn3/Csx3 [Spirulina sp. CCNP1310]MEA5420424.1 CRISPR-associated ring nuclease Crn3/Csx3 [Spirulina sp. CCNP1310]